MISGGEELRRLLILAHALWEAEEKLLNRFQREIDWENLDWFEREKFDTAMNKHRRLLRAHEEFNLGAAYKSEPVSITCTFEERSEALRLAFDVLEGNLTPESAVDRLWSEGFPHDVFGRSTSAG